MNTIETYNKDFSEKIKEILEKSSSLNLENLQKASEDRLKSYLKEICENFDKKFSEKFEMLRGFKYVENELMRLEKLIIKPEGEDAMLARKPLGGWSCGSCEKNLEKLNIKIASYSP